MRTGRMATLALLGGAAAWAARETVAMRRLRAAANQAGRQVRYRATQAAEEARERASELADAADVDDASATTLEPEAAEPRHPVDVDGPTELVEAERDLLTVPAEPGEEHRRRDQTAGPAAQELAAAQVRMRRNLHDEF